MRKLSIVIPVYYNEASLPALFEALGGLEKELARRKMGLQLILVDDGSGDGSWEVLKAYKRRRPGATIIKLTRNFGAVRAAKTGLRYVKGDVFGTLAADLQDPPKLMLEMVDHWLGGAKFVIAERITRDDPFVTRAFSWAYYALLRFLVIPDYPKGGYDMALMDRAMLQPMVNSSKSLFTPLLAYWLGYKPVVLHYHRSKREHGASRWTFSKKYNAFLDVMLGFSITPVRLVSGFGALISMASFAYGGTVAYAAWQGRIQVQGWSSLIALTSFLLGLIILMLGVIGEYLWRIFDETNRRPETVIEEVR